MGDDADLATLVEMGFDPDRASLAVKQEGGLDVALNWLEQDDYDQEQARDEELPREGPSAVDTEYRGTQNPFAHLNGKSVAPQQYAPPPGLPPNLAIKMASMTVDGQPATDRKDLRFAQNENGRDADDEPPSYPLEKGQISTSYPPEKGRPAYPDDKKQGSYGGGKGQSPYDDDEQYADEKSEGSHNNTIHTPHHLLSTKSAYISGKGAIGPLRNAPDEKQPGGTKLLLKRLTGDKQAKDTHMQKKMDSVDQFMQERWGPPGTNTYDMVMRYWVNTHMKPHWIWMHEHNPNDFKKLIKEGYCEPIPTAWVINRTLAWLYPEGSYYETPAEKRLYYFLNNGMMPGVGKHPPLRPLNINRDRYTIIKRGNERNARARPLDPKKLKLYASKGDVFQGDRQIQSHEYSTQVDNIVYEARTRALHALADGIIHSTDHLETMLLVDVSGSMLWNPHGGITGPDGIRRFHDQPSNIRLVEHLVHRCLQHMIPRQQKEHPNQLGIDTVTFSNYGTYQGQMSANQFRNDWSRVRLGGGTQVMQGWQVVKNTYFQHQHDRYGHGRYDKVFGWQPTPGMPKLSLLLFLDGECQDMDEFELELLGESWAYVTVALVGMEGCPHHHSHAIELERVAKFNPHVGFFDVHGRVCERMCVEDLLKSVYPVDPPGYAEILKPEYDLPAEELPAYKA